MLSVRFVRKILDPHEGETKDNGPVTHFIYPKIECQWTNVRKKNLKIYLHIRSRARQRCALTFAAEADEANESMYAIGGRSEHLRIRATNS